MGMEGKQLSIHYFLKLCNRYMHIYFIPFSIFVYVWLFHNEGLRYFLFLTAIFFGKNSAKRSDINWYFEFSISKLLLGELNRKFACDSWVIKSFEKETKLSAVIIPLRPWNAIWRAKMWFPSVHKKGKVCVNTKDKLNIITKYWWSWKGHSSVSGWQCFKFFLHCIVIISSLFIHLHNFFC